MLKEERFDDVAALYIHIVEREPAEADLFQELVPQMREAGAMGAANQILLTAGPFHGNDPHFLFDLAHEHQQLGNLDEASECYQQLLAIEPEHLQAYRHLGEVLLELDRNEQAQEVLEAARKVMPGNARITNLLGVVHHRHGRFKEAARLYQKAARLDKTDSDYPLNEGFAWRDLGEVQKAADALDRALERDPDDTYLLQEAGLLWLELDLDRAVELFQHATRIDGEDPYNYRLLGDALRRASEYNQARDAFRTAIDIDPGDHFSYNGLGLIHEAQDELDQAIERYRKAAELLPEEPVYHRNLGFRLMDDHAADEAIRTLEKAVELEPGHAMTHAILGQLYRDNDQAEKALYHLREAQRLEPDDPNSRRELGYLLHDMRDYEGAIDSYREGLVCDPEDALTHFNLGQALLLLEQFEEAECHLRRAAELDGDCNPYPELGVALHRLGKTEASREIFEKALARDPSDDYALSGYALLLMDLGETEKAISMHQEAARFAPREPQHYHNLGDLYFDRKEYKKALEAYRKALRLDSKRASTWNGIGVVLEHMGRFEEAAEHYGRSAMLAPDDALPYANLASMFYQLGQDENAVEAFDRAIALGPEIAGSYNGMGAALLRLGRPAEAVNFFRKAIQRESRDYRFHHNLGMALFHDGEEAAARQSLQAAVDLCPDDSEAWKTLGLIYMTRGDSENAYEYLERAHELNPEDKEVRFGLWNYWQNNVFMYEQAYEQAQYLQRAEPENTTYQMALALSALTCNLPEEAQAVASRVLSIPKINADTRGVMTLVQLVAGIVLGREEDVPLEARVMHASWNEAAESYRAWNTEGLYQWLEDNHTVPLEWRNILLDRLDRNPYWGSD